MAAMTPPTVPGTDPDPMPQPPPEPDFDACCGNGCTPCIFDLHDLAMDRYRQALRAWRARHPEAASTNG
jgi:hypothetical protein